jgi:peptidoglycan/LPS O-acetylase OafA/YrhL
MASVAWFNMHLAETSFEYAFQGVDPSPLLHFWSLAVEEQFYLLWPFILRALPSDSVKHTRNYRLRFMIVLWLLSFSLWYVLDCSRSRS